VGRIGGRHGYQHIGWYVLEGEFLGEAKGGKGKEAVTEICPPKKQGSKRRNVRRHRNRAKEGDSKRTAYLRREEEGEGIKKTLFQKEGGGKPINSVRNRGNRGEKTIIHYKGRGKKKENPLTTVDYSEGWGWTCVVTGARLLFSEKKRKRKRKEKKKRNYLNSVLVSRRGGGGCS